MGLTRVPCERNQVQLQLAFVQDQGNSPSVNVNKLNVVIFLCLILANAFKLI